MDWYENQVRMMSFIVQTINTMMTEYVQSVADGHSEIGGEEMPQQSEVSRDFMLWIAEHYENFGNFKAVCDVFADPLDEEDKDFIVFPKTLRGVESRVDDSDINEIFEKAVPLVEDARATCGDLVGDMYQRAIEEAVAVNTKEHWQVVDDMTTYIFG